MTEILCRWLNEELQLSRRVDPEIFAKEFSTGYLIGEILNKHQLQNDFDQFSQGRNAVSQLNNFQRLLPTLQLLGVMFSDIVVKALIAEQHGVATRLLYQIYIALRRKKSAKFPKLAMDTLGASKLASISAEMYKERLRSVIPREVDVVLRSDPHHPVVQGKSTEEVVIPQEEQKLQKRHSHQEEQQTQNEGPYTAKRKNKELKGKSKASIIPITMMPQGMTKTVQIRKQELRTKEAEMFLNEITKFEKILKDLTPEGGEERESSRLQPAAPPEESGAACVRGEQTRSFIENVRKRLTDDAKARKEREKRRRRVLLEQLEAHEAQEEVYREEQLVHRLMRQSLQERRITVQLMHARHEKQIMIQNRIYREKQYEEQRLKEFTDSLDREKMVVRQELLERAEERDQQRQVHEMLLAERAERRFRKHYALCLEVAEHIVDLATMVAEYSDLTFGLIPSKMMREWKELFFAQKPIYEQLATAQQLAGDSPEDIEMAKQQLHNAHDYEDYQVMTGEWEPPADGVILGPPPNNNVLGHAVQRIMETVHPTREPSPPPSFPPFPIRAGILGKVNAGKTSCLKHLAQSLNLQAVNMDTVLQEAVQAAGEGETVEHQEKQEGEAERGAEGKAGGPDEAGAVVGDVVAEGQDGEEGAPREPAPLLSKSPPVVQLESGPGAEGGCEQQPVPESTKEQKEIPGVLTSTDDKQEPQLSARAQLGQRAADFLKKGESVPDQLLVEIMTEYLRRLPVGCGWILDGFPMSLDQAKLLEKALTGVHPDTTAAKTKRSKTKLVVDPKAPPDQPPPPCALDIAILLEVSDSTALARHFNSACAEAEMQDTPGQQEELGGPEVTESTRTAHEQELPRLAGFLDHWAELESWLEEQHILVKVNGELERSELLEKLQLLLVQALLKKHSPETVLEKPPEMPPPAPAEAPPAQEAPKEGILAAQGSVSAGGATKEKNKASLRERKQSKAGSAAPPDSGKSSAKGTGKKAGESPGDRKQSKPGSTKGKKGKDQKGKLEAQALEPASQLDSGLPPPPKPGSDQWVYVDEPVPQEIAEYLARYWSDIVVIYTSTIHMVLQELRQERHRLIHNLHTLWRDFGEYLDTRPDHKQEFVSRWLEDFNSVNDDLRSDNDVKAELLLRLYNLRECLWDISDRRKEEAMRERQNLIGNGWLQDHLGIILNLYTTLMQVEVDRFQDSARFLQDYYKGMEGKIPLEHNKEFARIPLVDVADVEPPTFTDPEMGNIQLSDGQVTTENSSPTPQDKDQQESEQQKGQEMKSFSPPQMSDGQRKAEGSTPATRGEEQQGGEQEGAQETNPSRVPLVPYRIPSSSSSAVKDKGKAPLKAAARAKEEVQTVEALLHTSIDDYLIFEAHNTATSTLTNLIQREVKIKEDEERKEEKLKEEKEQQKSSAGKDSKKKSAGKKKGLHSTTPKLPVVVENPEEARRRELSERMFIEYLTALDSEAVAVTCRLDLIKLKALAVVQDLNAKADEVFATMEDWLGSQFLQEMDSIAALLAVGLEHIEDGTKIKYHLALGSKEFFVDGDVKLVEDPGPPPRQPSAETPKAGQMTVQQLRDLVQHFTGVSPTGLMMRRTFIETLHDLVSQDLGSDSLPEPWCNITYPQVVELARVLAADSDFLDWRQFVLPLAQPWPYPSLQELLQTKARFQALDQADSGYVTEQRYEQVELWFTGDEGIQVPDDPVEPIPFDRLRQLKQAFFSMFVVGSGADCRLDYNNMLLYFAAHRDPAQGLHRALSLTVGDPLPWTPIPTASPSQLEPVASLPVPEWRLSPDEGLPGAVSHKVPLSAVIQVSSHGPPAISDTHRHAGQDTETQQRCKRFAQVYKELGSKELEPVAFDILLKHPVIVDLITNTMRFSQPDIQAVVQRRLEPEGVANSSPDPSVEPSVSSPTDEPGRQSRRRIHKA